MEFRFSEFFVILRFGSDMGKWVFVVALLLICGSGGGGPHGAVHAAKILGVFPFPGPSQYILAQPYFKALASRGHEVTIISAFPQKQPVTNFRDISVANILRIYDDIMADALIIDSKWTQLNILTKLGRLATQNVLENSEVQQLMQSKEQHFDLIVIETLVNEALFGLAERFGAHLIGVSTFGTYPPVDNLVGNTSPLSYIPHVTLGITDRMTFAQRFENFFVHTLEFVHRRTIHLPAQQALYRQHFPEAQHDLSDVCRNFSLILVNQHFSLSFPRPYVPNMVEVGGMHINRQSGVLPSDMQRFLNESGDEGVVYFSMGSNIQSKDLPKEKLDIILRTFGALKQRVMWKFEEPNLPGKPPNVFISKWFPQPDILAHPKLKLFMTHGGLLSTIEAIYHAKPVLGIPFFYDQFMNVERAKVAGFGLVVDFQQLTEADFKAKIEELLSQPKYTRQAQLMSRRYRDQPMTPLEIAIYWTEYVLRHEGASHMRVAAQDLNLVQYFSLDVIALVLNGIALVVLLVIWLLLKLVGVLFPRKGGLQGKEKRH